MYPIQHLEQAITVQYLHASRACGAIERLGGVPTFVLDGVQTFVLTLLGLGEEGLGGTVADSLVRELLC